MRSCAKQKYEPPRMRRIPTKPQAIRALLVQTPVAPPASLCRALSKMGSPDLLRKLGSRSDPIARDVLNRAAALISQDAPQEAPSVYVETPSDRPWLEDQAQTEIA
jgi:hypothetical protein